MHPESSEYFNDLVLCASKLWVVLHNSDSVDKSIGSRWLAIVGWKFRKPVIVRETDGMLMWLSDYLAENPKYTVGHITGD